MEHLIAHFIEQIEDGLLVGVFGIVAGVANNVLIYRD